MGGKPRKIDWDYRIADNEIVGITITNFKARKPARELYQSF
ncbi:MAG: hypothetical protein QXW82_05090 [Candidatus Bathyarchaeia archaeon]